MGRLLRLLLIAAFFAACQSVSPSPKPVQVDAAGAATIAKAFLVSGQSSAIVDQITTESPADVRDRWRVKVDALLRDQNHPQAGPMPIHALIDVDKSTGEARIFAQG